MEESWKRLELSSLWAETLGDPSIRVAILDGPVDRSHPSLARASLVYLSSSTSTVPGIGIGSASQHGTHITSVIFGQHDSQVLGIAPKCSGLIVPIFSSWVPGTVSPCSQDDLAHAINLAVAEGAHIINVSAGELSPSGVAERVLEDAVRNCVDAGVLIIAAAGNQGCNCLNIPGSLPSVLAVGAMDAQGNPVEYSNWGEVYQTQGILAPGDKILGAQQGGGTVLGSGTSYATAVVSGVAALLLSLQVKYGQQPNPQLIRRILLESAVKEENDSPRLLAGRLNVAGAISRVMQGINTSFSNERASTIQASEGDTSFASQVTEADSRVEQKYPDTSSVFVGPYIPTIQALKDKYRAVIPEKFGTVDIQLPNGDFYNVRDLHYFIDNCRLGMRLLPASDDGDVTAPDGATVPGSQVIDDFLRQQMNLGSKDPIYAIVSYTRPDENSVSLLELLNTRKLQLGHQHLAAYIGEGQTTHALERFANPAWKPKGRYIVWNVKGYPANIHTISLQGVEQRILNKNARIVDEILTAEAQAPVDTQNVKCRTIDINTTLQFYRDWIRNAEYLKDLTWFTNCANHKTIVVNVMLNVPHNARMFEEIFGEDGTLLWQDFKKKYAEVTGNEFTSADETYFEPLWKLEGLTAEEIRPLSLGDYNSFQAAKLENRLEHYTGTRPLEPGKGMAWSLETVADVIVGFMSMYVSFPDVGGIVPSLMLLSLKPRVQQQLGITDEQYMNLVNPIVTKLIIADSMVNAPQDPSWLRKAITELYVGLGGLPDDLGITQTPDPSIMKQVEDYLAGVRERLDAIQCGGQMGPFEVASWLRKELVPELNKVRSLTSANESVAGFFSSPGIIQRIALGMYETSPFVQIRTICTVMDQQELHLQISPQVISEQSYSKLNTMEVTNLTNLQGSRYSHQTNTSAKIASKANQETVNERYMPEQLQSDLLSSQVPISQQSVNIPSVIPSSIEPSACSCEAGGGPQLVYGLGKLDYDLVSQSRRDSIKQKMDASANPENPEDLLAYLDRNSWDASAIQWTLSIESTPIYVIQPAGPFAKETYELLRQFLREQLTEGVERISIPGFIAGKATLRTGQVVPIVVPEIRGMYSWTTRALINALGGEPPSEEASQEARDEFRRVQEGVRNFLDRVYYEIRNLGQAPQERAINFAATNAFEIERVYDSAIRENMDLDTIEVERSPICRPGTDCWDVKLVFFFPERQVQTVRKVYRFTVDVTDVVPATVGSVRSWFIR